MKAAAIGRVGDVNKLLQTQRTDSLCGACRIFVNGGAFPPFSEEPTRSEVRGISRGKFLKSLASQSPSKNRRAPPPSVKMRRVDESVE